MKNIIKFVVVYSSEKTGTLVLPQKNRQGARDVKQLLKEIIKYIGGNKSVHIEKHSYVNCLPNSDLSTVAYSKQKVY